ncbi:cAMP-regulated phosphoprotein 19-like [Macrosteles quadrilineatus]|uniref:cAMP-regulated phosphoprotein 19-like n=1 Tax=Macrosteles quadrilineatus TaxID=74068 RepID=UPI0023E0EA0D|nr:cAMP-regulated phosphoprotein 19-like [Macrosteles quadrilineatus]
MSEQDAENMSQTKDQCSESNNDHVFVKPEMTTGEVEKMEEAKLKAKYPVAPLSGHSAFLAKKLAKGQKYFDSGDYQMAKQTTAMKMRQQQAPQANLAFGTGEAIPTPESVPARKTSIIQPKFAPSSAT